MSCNTENIEQILQIDNINFISFYLFSLIDAFLISFNIHASSMLWREIL